MSKPQPIIDTAPEEIRLEMDKVWLRWIIKEAGFGTASNRDMRPSDFSGPASRKEVLEHCKEFNRARKWFLRNLDSDEILETPIVARFLRREKPLPGPRARFWFRFYLGRITSLEFGHVISDIFEQSNWPSRLVDLFRREPLKTR